MPKRDEVDEALASGAEDHLTRPLRAEELRQKVQSLKQSYELPLRNLQTITLCGILSML
jgi:PleD family two-component response regulator